VGPPPVEDAPARRTAAVLIPDFHRRLRFRNSAIPQFGNSAIEAAIITD